MTGDATASWVSSSLTASSEFRELPLIGQMDGIDHPDFVPAMSQGKSFRGGSSYSASGFPLSIRDRWSIGSLRT